MIVNKNCLTATPGGQVSTSKARVVSTTAGGNSDKTTRTPVDKYTSVPASGNETTTDNLDATSSLLNTTTGESTKVYSLYTPRVFTGRERGTCETRVGSRTSHPPGAAAYFMLFSNLYISNHVHVLTHKRSNFILP